MFQLLRKLCLIMLLTVLAISSVFPQWNDGTAYAETNDYPDVPVLKTDYVGDWDAQIYWEKPITTTGIVGYKVDFNGYEYNLDSKTQQVYLGGDLVPNSSYTAVVTVKYQQGAKSAGKRISFQTKPLRTYYHSFVDDNKEVPSVRVTVGYNTDSSSQKKYVSEIAVDVMFELSYCRENVLPCLQHEIPKEIKMDKYPFPLTSLTSMHGQIMRFGKVDYRIYRYAWKASDFVYKEEERGRVRGATMDRIPTIGNFSITYNERAFHPVVDVEYQEKEYNTVDAVLWTTIRNFRRYNFFGSKLDRQVVPVGYIEIDDFLDEDGDLQGYGNRLKGYSSEKEFTDVVDIVNSYINQKKSDGDYNTISNYHRSKEFYKGTEYDVLGFPIFRKWDQVVYETVITPSDDSFYYASDEEHFLAATKKMYAENMSGNKLYKDKAKTQLLLEFNEQQMKTINAALSGKGHGAIKGFTWHHHQVKGKFQLVFTRQHILASHTGGRALWGGGQPCRTKGCTKSGSIYTPKKGG